jgi:hypothetical protein
MIDGRYPNPYDEEQVRRACEKIKTILTGMLSGELGFIEGSRSVWREAPFAGIGDDDVDVRVFLAIDSETDALPVGRERGNWDANALERQAPEIAGAEQWARQFGQAAAERLLVRLTSPAAQRS